MIRFACPKCKQTHQADGAAAGTVLACPGCGQQLRVPVPLAQPARPPSPVPAPAPPPPAPAEDVWASLTLDRVSKATQPLDPDDGQADLSSLADDEARPRPELLRGLSPRLLQNVKDLGQPTWEYKSGVSLGPAGLVLGLLLLLVGLAMFVAGWAIDLSINGAAYASHDRKALEVSDRSYGLLGCAGVIPLTAGGLVTLLALTMRRRRVIVFTGGLLDVLGRRRTVCRWDQVEAVWQSVTRIKLVRPGGRVRRTQTIHYYAVQVEGGPRLHYNDRLPKVGLLGARILRETREHRLRRALERYNAGELVDFDVYAIDRKSLHFRDDRIPWRDVKRVSASQGVIYADLRGDRRGYVEAPVGQVANAEVFLALADTILARS